MARADLCGLLAEGRDPEAELALPLERGRLAVEAPHEGHVAVEAAEVVRGQVGDEGRVRGVFHAGAVGGEQLDELGVRSGGVGVHSGSFR